METYVLPEMSAWLVLPIVVGATVGIISLFITAHNISAKAARSDILVPVLVAAISVTAFCFGFFSLAAQSDERAETLTAYLGETYPDLDTSRGFAGLLMPEWMTTWGDHSSVARIDGEAYYMVRYNGQNEYILATANEFNDDVFVPVEQD